MKSITTVYSYSKALIRPSTEYIKLLNNYINREKNTDRLEYGGDTNNFWNIFYSYFKEPVHIIDNIYLGNVLNAGNYEQLVDYKIDTIINVTDEHACYFPGYFEYHKISIKDIKDSKFNIDFYNTIDILKNNVDNNKRILVHCHHGRSRSVSLIIAYLIKYKKYKTFQDAYIMMKRKKNTININTDFANQLRTFANNKDL